MKRIGCLRSFLQECTGQLCNGVAHHEKGGETQWLKSDTQMANSRGCEDGGWLYRDGAVVVNIRWISRTRISKGLAIQAAFDELSHTMTSICASQTHNHNYIVETGIFGLRDGVLVHINLWRSVLHSDACGIRLGRDLLLVLLDSPIKLVHRAMIANPQAGADTSQHRNIVTDHEHTSLKPL